jgi:hypothetical protein
MMQSNKLDALYYFANSMGKGGVDIEPANSSAPYCVGLSFRIINPSSVVN